MKIPWTTILFIAVAILVTLQVVSWLRKTPANETIIRSDIKIEQLEKQRIADSIALKQVRWEKDSIIAVSNERFNNLQNKKQPIINVIKRIPVIVNNLDREQLRSGAESY